MISREKQKTRVLVFDDDPIYCKIISRSAKNLNLEITTCNKMDTFCLLALKDEFDVALIDFNLELYRGTDVSKVIASKPMFLISENASLSQEFSNYSKTFKGFFPKNIGSEEILKAITTDINLEKGLS